MSTVTRRTLLASASAALTARSWAQTPGANERLRIGVIGCGGMATGHMKELLKMRDTDNCEIVAVCDVYQKRLEAAAGLTSAGKKYAEYRRLLDDKDIDYVLIATPEHWHAQMTLDAAAAGKHIYCEKPMTWSVEQAKKVVERIKQSRLKMQVGVQGMSDDSYETANRMIKEGAIGKVVLAQIDYSRNYRDDFWRNQLDPDLKPGVNLDWKAWLGPAPKRAFDPERYMSWRRYWDYSGGIATDLFIHRVTRIIRSCGLSFPDKGCAAGGKFFWKDSVAEIPDTLNILLDYPDGLTVQLISTMANDTRVEHMLRGHKATLTFSRTGFTIKPQTGFKDGAQEYTHKKTGAESIGLHHRNLQNAIRRGEALKCDVMLGYYGVVAACLGNESYRRRKYIAWDAGRQQLRRL